MSHEPKNLTPIELVRQRAAKSRALRPKKDGFKLGLAVEGGGAGGVISMGMLMALKDLDLLRIFDVFVGCSAGNMNLAYLLAGEAEAALSVYYDHVVNHKFMDTGRIVRGKYVLDMPVLEMILKKIVVLPKEKLLKDHGQDFYLSLTSVNPVEGRLLNAAQAKDHLVEYLLAGATIPILGGEPRKVSGKYYIDGTFAYPDVAIAGEALGCSHVLVLNTNPEGADLVDKYNSLSSKSYKQLLGRSMPEVEKLWQDRLSYAAHLRTLDPDLATSRIKAQMITVGRPVHKIAGFTNDQWLIVDGARKGYQAVVKLFQPEATVGLVPEIL